MNLYIRKLRTSPIYADGFYVVPTNLEAKPLQIITITKKRQQIEKSFRIVKTEFKTRPFYLQDVGRSKLFYLTSRIPHLRAETGKIYIY